MTVAWLSRWVSVRGSVEGESDPVDARGRGRAGRYDARPLGRGGQEEGEAGGGVDEEQVFVFRYCAFGLVGSSGGFWDLRRLPWDPRRPREQEDGSLTSQSTVSPSQPAPPKSVAVSGNGWGRAFYLARETVDRIRGTLGSL